jgi:CHAD domain-containing protein
MAYRVRPRDHTVEQALRRIAREQVDGAMAAIDGKSVDVATHEVRKCCKKVRALMRLVRPAFAGYDAENAEFRDIARLLSGSRDAKVLLDTFDLLACDAPKGSDPGLFAPLREQVAQELARPGQGEIVDARLERARVLLDDARGRVRDWSLEAEGWDALGEGLDRILRQARKAARIAAEDASAAHYHELRKRMKYHWYHTRLLAPLWPAMMKARVMELSELADLLGLHHDICVFTDRLGGSLPSLEHPHAAETILSLAADRHRAIERQSGPMVARLLAQSPQGLVDHWGALWQIWRAGIKNGTLDGGDGVGN